MLIFESFTSSRRAFTLIELLIVVAIIAVLAAIAVPNFLEAQVRSKVTRVRADMRSLATAIEAYHTDYNRYPYVPTTFVDLGHRLAQLTTPVAYMTSIPADPFVRKPGSQYGLGSVEDPGGATYLYNTGNNLVGIGIGDPASTTRQAWSLTSAGPKLEIKFPYWPFADTFINSGTYLSFIYDPTNGTVSDGHIFRRGGRKTTSVPALDSQ